MAIPLPQWAEKFTDCLQPENRWHLGQQEMLFRFSSIQLTCNLKKYKEKYYTLGRYLFSQFF